MPLLLMNEMLYELYRLKCRNQSNWLAYRTTEPSFLEFRGLSNVCGKISEAVSKSLGRGQPRPNLTLSDENVNTNMFSK